VRRVSDLTGAGRLRVSSGPTPPVLPWPGSSSLRPRQRAGLVLRARPRIRVCVENDPHRHSRLGARELDRPARSARTPSLRLGARAGRSEARCARWLGGEKATGGWSCQAGRTRNQELRDSSTSSERSEGFRSLALHEEANTSARVRVHELGRQAARSGEEAGSRARRRVAHEASEARGAVSGPGDDAAASGARESAGGRYARVAAARLRSRDCVELPRDRVLAADSTRSSRPATSARSRAA